MRLTTTVLFIGMGFAISAKFTGQQAQVSCFIAFSLLEKRISILKAITVRV